PGKTRKDHLIPDLIAAGLPAIEVYHPGHDDDDVARYRKMADAFDLISTGGSDYHGPGSGREHALGRVNLPAVDFARLVERAGRA
ncbi:MAG: phosphatase, partial [Vicinamibacterales bacterium]